MSSRGIASWHVYGLLLVLLFSTAVPRAFVVCVSNDDHVSLEATFEGDPCETIFIFGADAETGWPAATCTDIPAIQLSALTNTDDLRSIVAPPDLRSPIVAATRFASDLHTSRDASRRASRRLESSRPPRLELLALRTTVLRI